MLAGGGLGKLCGWTAISRKAKLPSRRTSGLYFMFSWRFTSFCKRKRTHVGIFCLTQWYPGIDDSVLKREVGETSDASLNSADDVYVRLKRIYYTLAVWRFKPFLSVSWRIHSYLMAVYDL